MKQEAPRHLKMTRLCSRLKIPMYQAWGIMEGIWFVTSIDAPAGDIGKLSNSEIAERLGYPNGDELIQVLIELRWLEQDEDHRLIVHDWSEHCNDTIDAKLARSGRLYADGKMPRMNRLAEKERSELRQKWGWDSVRKTASHKKPQKAFSSLEKPLPVPLPNLTLPSASASMPVEFSAAAAITNADQATLGRIWTAAAELNPDLNATEAIELLEPAFIAFKRREQPRGNIRSAVAILLTSVGDWCSPERVAALRAHSAVVPEPDIPKRTPEEEIYWLKDSLSLEGVPQTIRDGWQRELDLLDATPKKPPNRQTNISVIPLRESIQ